MEPVVVKEIKDVAVAVGKVSASLITSFQDGKFVLLQDGFSFIDDIPAILNAIEGANLIKDELNDLTQAQRADVKAAVIDTIVKDLGVSYTDTEFLLAVGDIAEAVLAIIYLITRKQEELPKE